MVMHGAGSNWLVFLIEPIHKTQCVRGTHGPDRPRSRAREAVQRDGQEPGREVGASSILYGSTVIKTRILYDTLAA